MAFPRATAKKRLCLALDVDDVASAVRLAETLKDRVGVFKIGSQLYTSEGPSVVKKIIKLGGQIFLDLKFHDIPNTVAGAARAATRLGVLMFNVHAAGGREMMRAASEAAQDEAAKLGISTPLVLAITVLTSIDETILAEELLLKSHLKDTVRHFAELAKASGANGVIASPQEVALIKDACGSDFVIVTPGVRPAGSVAGDQKRVTTPGDAIRMGSDYIVVGRPISAAKNPLKATDAILDEMQEAG